jgi:uncharacterized protein (TIGR03435 family)
VVSVKPNKSGSGRVMMNMGSGSTISAENISLKMLIQNAYNLKTQDQIVGLTGWATTSAFDIAAKVDAETMAQLKTLSKDDANEQRRRMMQALLADRFHLKVHHETKEMPVYDMVVAKSGPKLKEAAPDPVDPDPPPSAGPNERRIGLPGPGDPRRNGSFMMSGTEMTATGVPLSTLANILSQQLHRQVNDKTGLTGKYDFNVKYSRDDAPQPTEPGAVEQPTLIIAVEEQLGLKLDSTKGPVDTIVVDHVEQPSEN